MQQIVDQMVASQERRIGKAHTIHTLGRFATAFAKSQQPKRPRAASAAPTQTRSFDEIVQETEQELPMKKLPFGAGLQKQRINSLGSTRLRFKGQLVR
jgi:hypothetical protein